MDINLIKEIIRQIPVTSYWVTYSEVCSALKAYEMIAVEPDFFRNNNHDFRTYSMGKPNDFYIALAENFPHQIGSQQYSPNRHSYRKSRLTQAIPRTIKPRQDNILEVYGIDYTEEDKVFQAIKTGADLVEVLGKIIKKIARDSNQAFIEMQQIYAEFYTLYQQPIKSLYNQYYPHLKLRDLLKTIEFITVETEGVVLKQQN